MLKKWEKLPDILRIPEVKEYYDILKKKQISMLFKRVFVEVMLMQHFTI